MAGGTLRGERLSRAASKLSGAVSAGALAAVEGRPAHLRPNHALDASRFFPAHLRERGIAGRVASEVKRLKARRFLVRRALVVLVRRVQIEGRQKVLAGRRQILRRVRVEDGRVHRRVEWKRWQRIDGRGKEIVARRRDLKRLCFDGGELWLAGNPLGGGQVEQVEERVVRGGAQGIEVVGRVGRTRRRRRERVTHRGASGLLGRDIGKERHQVVDRGFLCRRWLPSRGRLVQRFEVRRIQRLDLGFALGVEIRRSQVEERRQRICGVARGLGGCRAGARTAGARGPGATEGRQTGIDLVVRSARFTSHTHSKLLREGAGEDA